MIKVLSWLLAMAVMAGLSVGAVYAVILAAVWVFVRPFADVLALMALAPCG